MSDRVRSLIHKGRWAIPVQFKSMSLVIWPIGNEDYKLAHPSCDLEQMSIHIVPNRRDLVSLSTNSGYRISDDDWIYGHFDTKLEQSQTAICGFSGGHLAHVIWAALGAEAGQRLVWDPPLELNWNHSTVLSGAYTPPKYRGKGAFPFTVTEGLRYLKALGLTKAYTAFHWKNDASRRALQKANALFAAHCFRMRLRFPRRGVRYIPLLAYGYRAGTGGKWYRRQFTEWIEIMPVSIV